MLSSLSDFLYQWIKTLELFFQLSFYLQPIQSLDLSHCQQNEFCLSFNFLSLIGSKLWFQRSRKKFSNFPPCKLTKSRNSCLCGLLICNWVCYYECKSTKNVKKYRILGRISCVQASHYEELFCLVKHGWEEETLQYMLAKFTVAPFFLFFAFIPPSVCDFICCCCCQTILHECENDVKPSRFWSSL